MVGSIASGGQDGLGGVTQAEGRESPTPAEAGAGAGNPEQGTEPCEQGVHLHRFIRVIVDATKLVHGIEP